RLAVGQRQQRLAEPALRRAEPLDGGVDVGGERGECEFLLGARGLGRERVERAAACELGLVIDVERRVARTRDLELTDRAADLAFELGERGVQAIRGGGEIELRAPVPRRRLLLGGGSRDLLALANELEAAPRAHERDALLDGLALGRVEQLR